MPAGVLGFRESDDFLLFLPFSPFFAFLFYDDSASSTALPRTPPQCPTPTCLETERSPNAQKPLGHPPPNRGAPKTRPIALMMSVRTRLLIPMPMPLPITPGALVPPCHRAAVPQGIRHQGTSVYEPRTRTQTNYAPFSFWFLPLEFAFEIGSGLLTEVRRLQSLLGERDKAIQDMKEEKDDLEKSVEALRTALRQQEQSAGMSSCLLYSLFFLVSRLCISQCPCPSFQTNSKKKTGTSK